MVTLIVYNWYGKILFSVEITAGSILNIINPEINKI